MLGSSSIKKDFMFDSYHILVSFYINNKMIQSDLALNKIFLGSPKKYPAHN